MKKEDPEEKTSSLRWGTIPKVLTIFAIMLVGALSILLIMKFIPRETFGDFLIKSFASWVIALTMTGAVVLLLRSK